MWHGGTCARAGARAGQVNLNVDSATWCDTNAPTFGSVLPPLPLARHAPWATSMISDLSLQQAQQRMDTGGGGRTEAFGRGMVRDGAVGEFISHAAEVVGLPYTPPPRRPTSSAERIDQWSPPEELDRPNRENRAW